jgi:hypothetical protein
VHLPSLSFKRFYPHLNGCLQWFWLLQENWLFRSLLYLMLWDLLSPCAPHVLSGESTCLRKPLR